MFVLSRTMTLILSVTLILLGTAVLAIVQEFPEGQANTWGPGIYPSMLAIGIIVLAVLTALLEWAPKNRNERIDVGNWRRITGILLLSVVYLALLPGLGFLIVTPIWLCAVLWLLNRRPVFSFLLSLLLLLLSYGTFVWLLQIQFPRGSWTGI